MHISKKIKTPPTIEPVDFAELKEFARIDHDAEDNLLKKLIITAREAAEKYTNRALITQTWEMSFDFWANEYDEKRCNCDDLGELLNICGGNPLELDNPPLQSIVEIRTLDNDGNSIVVSSDDYIIDIRAEPGVISAITIPSGTRDIKAIEVEYIAGYGNTGASVPQSIKHGIMMWALDMYSTRIITSEPPKHVMGALDTYRILYL